MHDIPVFLQMVLRALALLAAGFWMHTLANPEKKEADPSEGPAKAERSHPAPSEKSPEKPAGEKPADSHGK